MVCLNRPFERPAAFDKLMDHGSIGVTTRSTIALQPSIATHNFNPASSHNSPLPVRLMQRSQEKEAIAHGPSRSSQAVRSHQKDESEFGETIPSKTDLNRDQLQQSTWSGRQITTAEISRTFHRLHRGQPWLTCTPGIMIMSSPCTRTGLQTQRIRKAALRAVLTRRIGSRSSYLYHLVHFAGIGTCNSTASHRYQMQPISKRGTCDQAFLFALPRLAIHP
jgi:hypothetical protein